MMPALRFATSRPDDSASALHALAARARGMSEAMLLALEIFGLLTALAILVWLPSRSGLSLPFVALSVFGVWGIAEHKRRKSGTRQVRTALSILQFLLAAVGILAVAALLFRAGELAIGTVVS